ncbi:MAG TPA: hypothetical protein VFA07_15170 [Chthonomonadaceae bacterium]|nr:hypothetical protein [Chthonomonadaceae bacterium]
MAERRTTTLDRYPIMAVRAAQLRGEGTWWDVSLREYLGGENHGPETRGTAANALKPGLLLYDVPKQLGLTGTQTLRIRLSVGALRLGGYVDYAYVRFIRREAAGWLQANPGLRHVLQVP